MLYDVAVIGAGAAGAVFARELAIGNPGLQILVIDGQSGNREKVCGGLLAPDAQKVLAEFSLNLPNTVLADPQIFSVKTLDLRSGCIRDYQRHYLNMDRAAFDRWLVSLIPDHVEIVSGRCFSLEAEEDGYRLSVSCEGEHRVFRARSIVGADGGGSVVRRTLFNRPLMQYVAIQQWYPAQGSDIPAYSCIFDPMTSDSCSWTICKDRYFIFGGAFPKMGCHAAFAEQKGRLERFLGVRFGEAEKTEACLLTSPRRMRDFLAGRPGVYLVGEAAGFISASSFEGISSAMISGRILARAYLDGNEQGRILRLYRRRTLALRLKLWGKIQKRRILCSPLLRFLIMRSGICAVKPYRPVNGDACFAASRKSKQS